MTEELITIICPECNTKYPLAMDTLKASKSVRIICKNCGESQLVQINDRSEIEIITNPTAWSEG